MTEQVSPRTPEQERIVLGFDMLNAALSALQSAGTDDPAARRKAGEAIHRLRDALVHAALEVGVWSSPPEQLPGVFEGLSETARSALSWIKTHVSEGRSDAALIEARRLEAVGIAIREALDPAAKPVFADMARREVADKAMGAALTALAQLEGEAAYLRRHLPVLTVEDRESRLTSAAYLAGVARNQVRKLK
jgi:hypothetical protein